jgi:hypothetical protein
MSYKQNNKYNNRKKEEKKKEKRLKKKKSVTLMAIKNYADDNYGRKQEFP